MLRGPVVIGGIGGSGTRVVAEMLAMMDFFMGTDLNEASDNLSYTLIFKRPGWFRKNADNKKMVFRGLQILEKAMLTGEAFTFKERVFLLRAAREMARYGHNRDREGKGEWAYERLSRIKRTVIPDFSNYSGWGWKEPNTHLLVPLMHEYFKEFKYIHTLRHGLDMAFSANQQQLFNWASLYGIELPDSEAAIPGASLKYWVKANQQVYNLAEELGQEKILIINYDALCRDPLPWIEKLTGFLNITPDNEIIEKMALLPRLPDSAGRYRQFPLSAFDPRDIEEVKRMGFDCRC